MREELFAVVFVMGIFAGVFIIYMAMRQRSEHLAMLHRERLAMIERGQVPLHEPGVGGLGHAAGSTRAMSVGIVVIGLGLAFMTLISIAAASPEEGIGIGGAIVIIGGAFVVRSLVVKPESPPPLTRDASPTALTAVRPAPDADEPLRRE